MRHRNNYHVLGFIFVLMKILLISAIFCLFGFYISSYLSIQVNVERLDPSETDGDAR